MAAILKPHPRISHSRGPHPFYVTIATILKMYEEEGEQLAGSYAIFFAEGDSLAKQGEYAKAIESFSKVMMATSGVHLHALLAQALEFQPEDRACLVARSKCYLQLGDTTAALKDAEASLKEDSKYHGVSLNKQLFTSLNSFRACTEKQKRCTGWEILSML